MEFLLVTHSVCEIKSCICSYVPGRERDKIQGAFYLMGDSERWRMSGKSGSVPGFMERNSRALEGKPNVPCGQTLLLGAGSSATHLEFQLDGRLR